jgi:hypothetical protein
MKQIINRFSLVAAALLLTVTVSLAQTKENSNTTTKTKEMKTYVIEREMPEVGNLTDAQLKTASQNSCKVIKDLGPGIVWDHSYVTANKIYCVYKAESIDIIKEHAKKAGLPANSITEVVTVISPKTAD